MLFTLLLLLALVLMLMLNGVCTRATMIILHLTRTQARYCLYFCSTHASTHSMDAHSHVAEVKFFLTVLLSLSRARARSRALPGD
jgi:hypothetical protein